MSNGVIVTKSIMSGHHLAIGIAVLVAAGVTFGGVASASVDARHQPTATAADTAIPNLDTVKSQIATFYGDHVDAGGQHQSSANSPWAREVGLVLDRAQSYVEHRVSAGANKPAIVLDIDDTSLSTYSYGANNGFDYQNMPAEAAFALAEKLPAIPATLSLATWATNHGVAVFFVTGRPQALEDATEGNLTKAGYPTATGLYLKPTAAPFPPYLTCDASCTTIQYKSATRAHIESLGYDVLISLGDQDSDLTGGYAEATFKLPNPMYLVP